MSSPSKSLVIAVDYDDTWTADPALWCAFHQLLYSRGHSMVIATGRRVPRTDAENEAWDLSRDRHLLPSVPVVFCGGQLKEQALRAAGWSVDIWIDDMPGMIQDCRILGGAVDDKEL